MFKTVYVFNYFEHHTEEDLARFERWTYLFKAPLWFAALFTKMNKGPYDYAPTPKGL